MNRPHHRPHPRRPPPLPHHLRGPAIHRHGHQRQRSHSRAIDLHGVHSASAPEAGMNARQFNHLAAQAEAKAAWVAGWWSGKVVGIVLGMALAVLMGWAK